LHTHKNTTREIIKEVIKGWYSATT